MGGPDGASIGGWRDAVTLGGVLAAAACCYAAWTRETVSSPRAPESGKERPSVHATPSPADAGTPESTARRVALGKRIFFDESLSEPKGTSCAGCHEPSRAYSGYHGSTLGVALGSRPNHYAKRNTPSVLYLKFVPAFHVHWGEDERTPQAVGGFFWDGRAGSLVGAVALPLLDSDEMSSSPRRLVNALRASAYAEEFRREFGSAIDEPGEILAAIGKAEEAFLTSAEMSPFSSKYDDYIRGRATLTPEEARGLRLFRDPAKGACDGCHKLNDNLPVPERSLFTDYRYDAVAVPRNRSIPANEDASRYDLGLCKRPGDSLQGADERFCGSFRTPSLRNVSVRGRFMHNGIFSDLHDVVTFYATRGVDPARWYRGADFDDLPPEYRDHVNVHEAPYNRRPGERPALDDDEVDAVVTFLGTLTDAEFR